MTDKTAAPVIRQRFFDNNGNPLNNGKIFTYVAGSAGAVNKATYSTPGGAANANPIRTDPYGYCDIWLDTGGYLFTVKDSADNLLWTKDNITTVQLADFSASTGAGMIGKTGGGTVQTFIDVLQPIADGVIYSAVSGNYILGDPLSGRTLTAGAHVGDHNGDANTGLGVGVFDRATTCYASLALGYGCLANVTTGNGNTCGGYQAGQAMTIGIFNTLFGVDPALFAQNINFCTILGHHCLNGGNAAINGWVIIGDQVARLILSGDNVVAIGRNVMANSPTTGSHDAVVIGNNSAIKSSVATSFVGGVDVMQSTSGVGTRSITDSVLMGHRLLFGAQTSDNDAVVGAYALFQNDGDTMSSFGNAVLGSNAGYYADADLCVFVGYHTGAHAAKTALSRVVLIGPHAGNVGGGATAIGNNDFVLANDYLDAARLIWGNFSTRVVNMGGQLNVDGPVRTKVYTVGTLPAAPGAGSRAGVTDASVTTFATTVAAGGANKVPVYNDGTNWIIA